MSEHRYNPANPYDLRLVMAIEHIVEIIAEAAMSDDVRASNERLLAFGFECCF